jgi:8-oxo-dGTP pyrophosphatase MutT (NUDIX family)
LLIVMTLSFSAFTDRLQARLTADLPGAEAQRTMAPRYDARQHALSINGKDCREAGVLALVYPRDDTPTLVLTVRRDDLPDHPGQLSFPGGQREAGETLPDTALREAHEEVDLDPAPVQLLGALTPLYIPPSNFCVHPFVGVLSHAPTLRPTDREVGAILHVPLLHLLDPDTRVEETWTLHDRPIDVPYYDIDGPPLWGATAMMCAELLAVCRDALSVPDA